MEMYIDWYNVERRIVRNYYILKVNCLEACTRVNTILIAFGFNVLSTVNNIIVNETKENGVKRFHNRHCGHDFQNENRYIYSCNVWIMLLY